jgi:hypothetical protein
MGPLDTPNFGPRIGGGSSSADGEENMKTMLLALAMTAGLAFQASAVQAGDGCGCCAGCGCQCPCEMTCHLEKYMKKVTVTCYGCKCQHICIPGPSCPGCKHCEGCCDGQCGCDGGCDCDCNHRPDCHLIWRDWCPSGCATPIAPKLLVKYEVTKEIPAYKWVVQPLCCHCAEKAREEDKTVPAPALPPAPKSASAGGAAPVSFDAPVVR